MTQKLTGKVAIITGASAGIGLACARALASEGAKLVLTARRSERLEALIAEIKAIGSDAVSVIGDARDEATAVSAVAAALEKFGRVDILVNNAGTNIKDRTIRDLTPEAWDQMIRANLDGAFYCTKAVLPQMFERKDGVIVNVVSVAGKRANPLGGAAYNPRLPTIRATASEACRFFRSSSSWCSRT